MNFFLRSLSSSLQHFQFKDRNVSNTMQQMSLLFMILSVDDLGKETYKTKMVVYLLL